MKKIGIALIFAFIIMGMIISPFFVPDSIAYVGEHICNFNPYFEVFATMSVLIILALAYCMLLLIICFIFAKRE